MTGLVTIGWLHPGHWSACFGRSLIDLLFHDAANTGRVVQSGPYATVAKETGAAQIHAGRNRLARTVLDDTESEWLFMVDADMGFAPDTVDRLIAAADPTERPIVGALCFAQKSAGAGPMFARRYRCTPTVYRMAETDTEIGFVPMFNYPRDAMIEADATGAAAVLIHRTVLEKIRADYGDHWFDPITVPKAGVDVEFGEDMSFCLRARACGFPIYVDTSVKTTHDKGGVFFDEDTYDLQEAMRSIA